MRDLRRFGAAGWIVVIVATILLLTGCVSFGVDSYDEFQSAVDSGASCSQLVDMKSNFDGTADETRVEKELRRLGCESPSPTPPK